MVNTIKYNGYNCSVEYSQDDKCFSGQLEMIDNLITFKAASADALEENFHNIVDDYIENIEISSILKKRVFNKENPVKYITMDELLIELRKDGRTV